MNVARRLIENLLLAWALRREEAAWLTYRNLWLEAHADFCGWCNAKAWVHSWCEKPVYERMELAAQGLKPESGRCERCGVEAAPVCLNGTHWIVGLWFRTDLERVFLSPQVWGRYASSSRDDDMSAPEKQK